MRNLAHLNGEREIYNQFQVVVVWHYGLINKIIS
jgi:hypothetical protein